MPIARLLFVALLTFTEMTLSDQWMPPVPQTYVSRNGEYRLTIFPRELSSQLEYFEDKEDGEERPGQAILGADQCEATMERLVDSEYVIERRTPLINDVAPVSALVSGRNGSFVTFDNWHSTGHGKDVIAIYNASGNLIRKYALTDLITEEEFKNLPRSVSSIQWSGRHRLIDYREFDYIRLEIVLERPDEGVEPKSKTVYLRMSNGEIIPLRRAID